MTVLVRFPGVPPTNHRPRTDHDVSLQTGRHNSGQLNHFLFSVATRTAPAARLACISPLGCVVHRHRPMALRSLVYNRGYHGCALHLRRFRVSGMLTTFFLSYAPRHAATPVLGRSTSGLPSQTAFSTPSAPPPPPPRPRSNAAARLPPCRKDHFLNGRRPPHARLARRPPRPARLPRKSHPPRGAATPRRCGWGILAHLLWRTLLPLHPPVAPSAPIARLQLVLPTLFCSGRDRSAPWCVPLLPPPRLVGGRRRRWGGR